LVFRPCARHFSSGHDIGPENSAATFDPANPDRFANHRMGEAKRYLGYSMKWRNAPKVSICAVQGACIAGGLLLAWPCDLIFAAEDAYFSDPVLLMGIPGVEYHAHTWEMGPRKAKEFLLSAKRVTAAEAERFGMVNRVVPRDRLDEEVMAFASEISRNDPFALSLAKRVVNQALDVQGFSAALQACFDVHWLGHAHAVAKTNYPILIPDVDGMKARTATR
jgi:enoyl-CoA hydratase